MLECTLSQEPLSSGMPMKVYSVTEIAKETGLTAHTLRYYEKEFLLLDVGRDTGGRRRYQESHVEAIRFISALRATGMPIRTIQQYIELYRQGEHTRNSRMELLENHEQAVLTQFSETKKSLKMIRKKIGFYQNLIESSNTRQGIDKLTS